MEKTNSDFKSKFILIISSITLVLNLITLYLLSK